MQRIFSSKWFWIAVAVLLAAGLTVLVLMVPELLKPVLWTVLVVGLLWIVTEVALRAWKKRKRAAFDESLTAKEGIEDRKREWEGFQAELDKQKIDRYELPFYLLVGEPQSGKSVLLQNSDLHFPFGQNKLSGIGGTRGCDWWFTEEAVILDLAGRLFTHEGGVADQLEWEAFLDMLASYRPLCPANGILLVVPCDSLLVDSADVARQKANKIQAALLTLTKKLEAQLPIYMVLTKADKLFGFAECVHRLDAPKRHEMFGWSRGGDKVDTPFDLEETRAGFRALVERARILRGEMLATARIPEALTEVDRMYAFPDELAALEEPLEIYLRRVFSESGLSDRLSFRGLYLTSGLQSGVPIARVCAEALGGTGDADMQELEALFTKQRAYFIKDLVRQRVFGEQGLVRPTKGRVIQAHRRAAVGYGVSGVIALASVIGGLAYLFSGGKASVESASQRALELARDSERSREWDVARHLEALSAIDGAIREERQVSEEIFNSTRESLKELYASAFDNRLAPRLRLALEARVREIVERGPASFEEAKLAAECATLLLSEIDFADGDVLEAFEAALPQREREFVAMPSGERFPLQRAIELRGAHSSVPALSPAPPGSAQSVDELAVATLELYERCLTPGVAFQPRKELGYMIAWKGVAENHRRLAGNGITDERDVLDVGTRYLLAAEAVRRCEKDLKPVSQGRYELKSPLMALQTKPLSDTREALAERLSKRGGVTRPRGDWLAKLEFDRFAEAAFASNGQDLDLGIVLGSNKAAEIAKKSLDAELAAMNATIEVPTGELANMLDPDLERACKLAPGADWALETLGAQLAAGVRDLRGSEVPKRLYLAKVLEVGRRFAERYPNFKALADERAAAGQPLAEAELALELVPKLVAVRAALLELDRAATRDFVSALEALLLEHLAPLEKNWKALRAASAAGVAPSIDLAVLDSLAAVRGEPLPTPNAQLAQVAQRLSQRYVQGRQDLMLDFWKVAPEGGEVTLELVRRLGEHLALMKARFGEPERDGDDGLDGAWLEEVEDTLVDRLESHARKARAYWTPAPLHGQAGLTLIDAALTVSRKLERAEFEDMLQGAAESVGAPPLDDPLFARNAPVFEKLERAAKALDELRKLRAPANARALTSHKYAEWLKTFADGLVKNPSLLEDGASMAAKIWEIDQSKRADQDIPDNAGGLYARALFDTLRLRMVDEIRLRYAKDLGKLLEDYGAALDALYLRDFDATKTLDELSVMQRLGALLDRNGKFDELIKRYRASEDTLGLFPKDPAVVEREPLWASQRFLSELQAFLLGKEGRRLQDGSVKLALRPLVNESLSIWDPSKRNEGWMEAFYAPSSALGDWEYEAVDRDMPEKILEWGFRADTAKRLRMRWSDTPSAAREFEPGDARIEILGSLAPLLLAWSGERQEDGSWRVVLTPTGSKLVAPFELRFLERELPVRPARPN